MRSRMVENIFATTYLSILKQEMQQTRCCSDMFLQIVPIVFA